MSFALLKRGLNILGPSLWRLLTVLKETGYVIYDAQTHFYRLGYRFLSMGSVLLQQVGFRSETRYLKKLVFVTGETAEPSTRAKDVLILVDQAETPQAVLLFSGIGSSCPHFPATATGKVYLAHMAEETLQLVIEKIGFPSITKFTLRSFRVMKKELKRIRSQGHGVENQEMNLESSDLPPSFSTKAAKSSLVWVQRPLFSDLGRNGTPSGLSGRWPRNSGGR